MTYARTTLLLFACAIFVSFVPPVSAAPPLKAGAAKVNDQVLTDPFAMASADDVVDGAIKLSIGKKRHALAKPV